MAGLPAISGIKKRGVVFLSGPEDLEKLEGYLINDTVCVDGPQEPAFSLAMALHQKYNVPVKVVSADKFSGELPADIEVIASPIQEILGEGRAEAVKFQNGKAVGVCLVLCIKEKPCQTS